MIIRTPPPRRLGLDEPIRLDGRIVGYVSSGAYGFTASPRSFLSHPEPVEILV